MSAHDTQQKILDFIVNHIEREGIPPTQREIAEAMKLARSSVDYHLTMLEKKGLITRESKKSRGIHLLQTYKKVPVWGRITTDESGLSVRSSLKIYSEPQEWIDVGQDLAGGNTYALIVQGGSMVEEHIRDGDYVVIKPQAYYENGDIIVAVHITHDGSANATLKRFFQGKDQVRLQPANSELNPIYVPRTEWDREWRVQGKVVALFRHLAVQRASPQDESSTYTIQDSRSSQDVAREVYNIPAKSYPSVEKLDQVSTGGTSELKLLAVARATLEEDDRALVGKTYVIQAGISKIKSAGFSSEPFNLSVHSLTEPIEFDILLHTSENVELATEWYQHLLYKPDNPDPQLVQFAFRLLAPGHSSLAINFYRERRWLKTIRFEFDAVEQLQPVATSLKR